MKQMKQIIEPQDLSLHKHMSTLYVTYKSYLAVVSGVISEADYIFCPESPPPNDWPERLCNKLIQAR